MKTSKTGPEKLLSPDIRGVDGRTRINALAKVCAAKLALQFFWFRAAQINAEKKFLRFSTQKAYHKAAASRNHFS
jgi:hypothetical protein